ncbi:MAG: acyltransferase family protein [Methylotenera sp.]
MHSGSFSVDPHKSSASRRAAWADLCRVVAMFGVVLIHSCGATFYQYGKVPIGDWLSANFLDSLSRCSVPLFVMISGALLLKRGRQVYTLLNLIQRINKVLFPLLTWSALYLLFVYHNNGVPVDWWSVIRQPAMYHLWFVYMIIGIYMMLPVFQAIFNTILEREDLKKYLFVLWVIITSVPVYQPLPLLSVIQQNSFFGYGGYFLIGAVIASSPKDRIPTSIWFLIFVISVLGTFGLTWRFSEQASAPIETAYLYFSPNVLVSAIAAFILITRARVSERVAKSLQWISDRSFLIYFFHLLALEAVRYSNFISAINRHAPMLVTILMISAATFFISLMVAAVIRLVPGFQRVFG